MDAPLKVMVAFGTRPEAVKMAPVVQALQRDPAFACVVAVSAQHREMLDQVLALFHLHPQYDLNIMQHGQSLTDVTTRVLRGMEEIIQTEKPAAVLVHGDTATAFATALAAFYQQTPVGHVEAGLRTFAPYDPFPEEMNRRLVDTVASWHYAPTPANRDNLLAEHIGAEQIYVTGNTVIEALRSVVRRDYVFSDPQLAQVAQLPGRMLLVTTHRRENLAAGRMSGIYAAFRQILAAHPEARIVFPVHKNPAVRALVQEALEGLERVHLIEPSAYADFINLMARCFLVLTDSGGLQEEAPALGKPVLVLRETTERPEGVAAGTVRKVGTRAADIVAAAGELLDDPAAYARMAGAVNPYGDGQAARRIVQALKHACLGEVPPASWMPQSTGKLSAAEQESFPKQPIEQR